MVTAHTQGLQNAEALAQAKGVTPSQGILPEHQRLLNSLSQQQGAGFDLPYLQAIIDHHEDAISAYAHYVATGNDPDVRQFAAQSLVSLTNHLTRAVLVRDTIDPSTTGTASCDLPAGAATIGTAEGAQQAYCPAVTDGAAPDAGAPGTNGATNGTDAYGETTLGGGGTDGGAGATDESNGATGGGESGVDFAVDGGGTGTSGNAVWGADSPA